MIGLCNHSLHTAIEAVRRTSVRTRASVLGDSAVDYGIVVAPDVRTLQAHQHRVVGLHVHVVVVDTLERLRSVAGIVVVDADVGDRAWHPRPIRMAQLRHHLPTPIPLHPPIAWVPNDPTAQIVAEACRVGILGSVLTLARKLPDAPARDRLYAHVVDHLLGQTNLATLARRTVPVRPALRALHDQMCATIDAPAGRSLGLAVRMVRGGQSVAHASERTGADAFEINYLLSKSTAVK